MDSTPPPLPNDPWEPVDVVRSEAPRRAPSYGNAPPYSYGSAAGLWTGRGGYGMPAHAAYSYLPMHPAYLEPFQWYHHHHHHGHHHHGHHHHGHHYHHHHLHHHRNAPMDIRRDVQALALKWSDDRLSRLVLQFDATPQNLAFARVSDVTNRGSQMLSHAIAHFFADALFDADGPACPRLDIVTKCYKHMDSTKHQGILLQPCTVASAAMVPARRCQCPDSEVVHLRDRDAFLRDPISHDIRQLLQVFEKSNVRNAPPQRNENLRYAATGLKERVGTYWHRPESVATAMEALSGRAAVGGDVPATETAFLTCHSQYVRDTLSLMLEMCSEIGAMAFTPSTVAVVRLVAQYLEAMHLQVSELVAIGKAQFELRGDSGALEKAEVGLLSPVHAVIPLLVLCEALSPNARSAARAVVASRVGAALDRAVNPFQLIGELPPSTHPSVILPRFREPAWMTQGYALVDVAMETSITRVKRIEDAAYLALLGLLSVYVEAGGPLQNRTKLCMRSGYPIVLGPNDDLLRMLRPGEVSGIEMSFLVNALLYEFNLTRLLQYPAIDYTLFAHGYYSAHPQLITQDTVRKHAAWRLSQVQQIRSEMERKLGAELPPLLADQAVAAYASATRLSVLHEFSALPARLAVVVSSIADYKSIAVELTKDLLGLAKSVAGAAPWLSVVAARARVALTGQAPCKGRENDSDDDDDNAFDRQPSMDV